MSLVTCMPPFFSFRTLAQAGIRKRIHTRRKKAHTNEKKAFTHEKQWRIGRKIRSVTPHSACMPLSREELSKGQIITSGYFYGL